jgi:MFS family permease
MKKKIKHKKLMPLIKFVCILSLILWFGAGVFFSFIVIPSLFSSLGRDSAGGVLGVIFPIYYVWGTLFGLLLFAGTTLWAWIEKEWSWNLLFSLVACALMLGANLYASYEISPKIREIKNVSSLQEKDLFRTEFNRLHRLSVILNTAVLILGLYYTVLFVLRI